jgi:hypothetical protein
MMQDACRRLLLALLPPFEDDDEHHHRKIEEINLLHSINRTILGTLLSFFFF